MEVTSVKNNIARIENIFIEKAQYKLGLREQKVILYLIANTNPKDNEFSEFIISVKELESILKSDGKKWGGIYKEMHRFCHDIMSKKIVFPSDILIENKPIKGFINWFHKIAPEKNKAGEVCLKFCFSPSLKPFLLQLKQYARINRIEIAQMRSSHSIRLFQIFKAVKEKQKRYKDVVSITYEVNELKKILGLYDHKTETYKYVDIRNLKKKVISFAKKEINSQTSIYIDPIYLKKGRNITHIRFDVYENNSNLKNIAQGKSLNVLKQIIGDNRYDTVDLKMFRLTYPKDFKLIEQKVEKSIKEFKKQSSLPFPNIKKTTEGNIRNLCLEFARNEIRHIKENIKT